MRYILLALALALVCTSARGEEWTPPADPDPQAILQEAHQDMRAGRYEIALAKHVWFHESALSVQPAMYGVRLSFALSAWHELAKEYPPALEKLKQVRDKAAQQVTEGKDVRVSFHDMAAINRTLGAESLTQESFEALHDKNPKAAKEVIGLATPALIRGKAYKLIAGYVEPKTDIARIIESYEQGKRLANDPNIGASHLQFANKKFVNDASTLVAVLAINDRKAEAQEVAGSAKEAWNDASFHAEVDKALSGVVPEPWP